REDYYISQSQGRWWGSLAPEFGLHGGVEKRDFATLHDGFSPAGEPLCLNVKHPLRRPAFDLTHSLVKDASIIASRSPEWRRTIIERVLDPSCEVSLRYIEREACFSRRGRDGAERVEGRGLVAAAFDHMVTRSVLDETKGKHVLDPQVHRHVVAFNS